MNLDAIEPLKALGIELVEGSDQAVVFHIPLLGNRNDKGTLFAGSQYSGLVLAGWYLASRWAASRGLGEKVAIKDCHVRYPKAASTAVTVTATLREAPDLRPSGHWRALISVQGIDADGDTVSELDGDYRILVG